MNHILSYDSKFMKMLEMVADTMILNILFLICCIPVVTIGAAFTALFSGCRALANEGAPFKSFFRGLRSGFARSTVAWIIHAGLILLFVYLAGVIWLARMKFYLFSFLVTVIALMLILSASIMTYLFYSKFECTMVQLLKNGVLMFLSYPMRGLLMGVFNWGPVLSFFLMPELFGQLVPIWLFLFSGVVGNVSVWLMKKPFESLTKQVEDEPKAALEEEPV